MTANTMADEAAGYVGTDGAGLTMDKRVVAGRRCRLAE
jgi:hypothetical protein